MNYIIPAAGIGTRLHPLTQESAKCLFKLGPEMTIIKRMIKLLNKFDSNAEIIIITGFAQDKIHEEIKEFSNIRFIHNPFYKVTNSIASVWLAREYMNGSTVIINSDIVFEQNLCKEVITAPIREDAVLMDGSIRAEGDYNVQVHGGLVTVMSKELNNYHGEYAGVTRLTDSGVEKLKFELNHMVNGGYYNQWYETALVQMIFSDSFQLHYIDIQTYSWTEVDTVDDLLKAKEIYAKF